MTNSLQATLLERSAPVVIEEDYPEPRDASSSAYLSATLWHAAAIVTATAAGVIFFLGILHQVIIPFSPTFFLLLVLAPLVVGSIYSTFYGWSFESSAKAEDQEKILLILKGFEDHSRAQMSSLLMTHGIDPSRIPLDHSSRSFKILFAHFLHHMETLRQKEEMLRNPSHPLALTSQSSDNDILRYHVERSALREFAILPQKVKAACLIQRMYRPSSPVRTQEIGIMTPKIFSHRHASQLSLGDASPYFVFHNEQIPPIRLSEIEHLSIHPLRERLFAGVRS